MEIDMQIILANAFIMRVLSCTYIEHTTHTGITVLHYAQMEHIFWQEI